MTRDELVEKVARAMVGVHAKMIAEHGRLANMISPGNYRYARAAIRLIVEECARVAEGQREQWQQVAALRREADMPTQFQNERASEADFIAGLIRRQLTPGEPST